MKQNPIGRAVAIVGSQAELARRIGVAQTHISKLSRGRYKNGLRAEYAIKIEEATGGIVRREDLRPDIFGKGA